MLLDCDCTAAALEEVAAGTGLRARCDVGVVKLTLEGADVSVLKACVPVDAGTLGESASC